MNPKFSIYAMALIAFLILPSCNDWLDVNPRQEMKENMMYSNEDGYKSVLTGAYIQLASSSLYGKNTSMYLPELLTRHWSILSNSSTTLNSLENMDYTYSGVESLIETVWKRYYKAIVHLNDLLGAFNDNEVYFTYQNDQLIKGEATGLRAFLHFELLRYFGPIPSDAVGSDRIIPYVTEMTKDPNRLVSQTWAELLRSIEEDLDEAEKLLVDVDPIVTGEETPDDDWHYMYRENRFNYYAVLGTKARFYHWIGEKEKAVKYAKMVIEAVNKEGNPVFTLANETSYSGFYRNLIMNSEMLFGVHNSKHQDIVLGLFKGEEATLTQTARNINKAYESDSQPDDIRNKSNRYWEEKSYMNAAALNYFLKYTGNDTDISPKNVIPLLRMSELYLIVIEDLPLDEAKPYFVTYRIARSMSSSLDGTLTSENAVMARLEKEYRKEFFGEGQMFFFYKRLNYKAYTWPSKFTVPEGAYVLPLPKSQLSFE